MPSDKSTTLTGAMVRELAHPLRARMLALLRIEGPSTASRLAQRLGTNSGATSYHLRRLGGTGLAEEVEGGTGRERWWQAAHEYHSFTETSHADDPDERSAADWLVRYAHRQYAQRVDDWLDVRTEWPAAWRDVAEMSDYRVRVTPEQLDELNRRIREVVAEFHEASSADDEDAELVGLIHYAFPFRAVQL